MITIICTTNRPDSNSFKISELYEKALSENGEACQILDLRKVDAQWIQDSHYTDNVPQFDEVVQTHIRSVNKLVFIVPEYNGGFPGYLKFFMDACDYGDWQEKKVAMLGLATGRGGNIRGVDHLTGILHYLGSEVFSKKVYLSQVNQLLTENGELASEMVSNEIDAQIKGFVTF